MPAKRILIADDESTLRRALRLVLESDYHAVEEAADGCEALSLIRTWLPDVVMLDLVMPNLDGIGVLTELKAVPPAKPPRVIVLSGHGSIATAVKAIRLGALEFLEKPASVELVRETIASVLAERLPDSTGSIADREMPATAYAETLERARIALRAGNYRLAESLLIEVEDRAHENADYLNLLGIYHESQRQWRLARKFYARAIAADSNHEPAQANLRRLRETNQPRF